MALQNYREVEVWQKAMTLAVDCYGVTREFPRAELFGLTSQIRRAAASIPANIAEGQGRQNGRALYNKIPGFAPQGQQQTSPGQRPGKRRETAIHRSSERASQPKGPRCPNRS